MSNNTNPDLVGTLTDSFLNWFQKDILSYFVATFDIIVIIIGCILNTMLIVTFKKRGLFKESSTHFVFMLTISDFIAFVLLLLPTIITAFAREWILSYPVCLAHGSMTVLMVYVSFALLAILALERVLKLSNPELYQKTFDSKIFVNVLTIAIWTVCCTIASVNIAGIAELKYDFYHQGCMLDYMSSYILLNIHFGTTFGISFVIVLVCYSVIFDAKRRALIDARTRNFKQTALAKKIKETDSTKEMSRKNDKVILDKDVRETPSVSEGSKGIDDKQTMDVMSGQKNQLSEKPNRGIQKNSRRTLAKSASRQSLILEVFSDDDENPAFHLAMTYLLLWFILVVCYLPYYTVWYYDAYNPGGVWGGFYTITMLIIHTSFVVKPIIYLGHNRHYRAVTKETIPEGVRAKARAVRASVSNVVERVDDFVFRSASNKRFAATVTAQRAVLVWKKKLQKVRKSKMDLKQKPEEKTPIVALSITEAETDSKPNKLIEEVEETPVKKLNGTNANGGKDLRPTTSDQKVLTPSNIEITSSSFIERERQRLLGDISAPPPANYQEPNIVPPAVYFEKRDKL